MYVNEPQTQGLNSKTRRDTPQKVFVYGTLKKGFGNWERLLKENRLIGSGTVEGLMFHLGAFPAINLSEKFCKIQGEVYEVDWDKLMALDLLEGVGHNFYDRIETKVEPYGAVWTYIFPVARASKERYLVPSGNWRGPDTPKVTWEGFGKGVEIGSFQSSPNEIRIGPGEGSDWVLRRNEVEETYNLINKKTGEVLGKYAHLRDMIGADGRKKPVIRLPSASRPTVGSAVSTVLLGPTGQPVPPTQVHPSHPILWPNSYPPSSATQPVNLPMVIVPERVDDEQEVIPQAARLLGMKYGEA